jgi:hypothetical protein
LDETMRQDESILNREILDEYFTIEANAQNWISTFKEIVKL